MVIPGKLYPQLMVLRDLPIRLLIRFADVAVAWMRSCILLKLMRGQGRFVVCMDTCDLGKVRYLRHGRHR